MTEGTPEVSVAVENPMANALNEAEAGVQSAVEVTTGATGGAGATAEVAAKAADGIAVAAEAVTGTAAVAVEAVDEIAAAAGAVAGTAAGTVAGVGAGAADGIAAEARAVAGTAAGAGSGIAATVAVVGTGDDFSQTSDASGDEGGGGEIDEDCSSPNQDVDLIQICQGELAKAIKDRNTEGLKAALSEATRLNLTGPDVDTARILLDDA